MQIFRFHWSVWQYGIVQITSEVRVIEPQTINLMELPNGLSKIYKLQLVAISLF